MEIVICYAKEFRYTQKEHFADSTKGTACAHAAQYVIDNNLDPFCTFYIREHGAWVEGNASWALMFADALEVANRGWRQAKKQLEEALEVLREKHEVIQRDLHDKVEALAKEWLGDAFVCSRASLGYHGVNVEIAVENKEKPGEALFGHEFQLSYGRGFLREDEMKLEMNYGTLGSFDLQQDEDRITYLQGMAKLASNNHLKNALLELFNDCIKKEEACSREYNQIKKLLDNPLAQN